MYAQHSILDRPFTFAYYVVWKTELESVPVHALQPAGQRSNADTLVYQLAARCQKLIKQTLTGWDLLRQLQRVQRHVTQWRFWFGRSRIEW